MSPEMIREYLFESGYVEDDPVTDPGEFSLRGGILDIFPPHLEKPVRLEFFGDQIESIRIFDVDSQRSVETVHTIEIIPMREYCFRRDLLREWAEKVPSLWSAPFLPHLEEELALARQGEMFPAFEFLLPAVDPLDKTLFDYLRGYRIITLEREVLENALTSTMQSSMNDSWTAWKRISRSLLRNRSMSPPMSFARRWTGFRAWKSRNSESPKPESARSIFPSQSTRKYHGNIRELIGDLEKFRESGENIAFVLSNLGRAERMNDILKEYEIPAHLCRPGEQDAAEGLHPGSTISAGHRKSSCRLLSAGR